MMPLPHESRPSGDLTSAQPDASTMPPGEALDGGTLARFVNESPRAKAMFDIDMRYIAASQRWCVAHNTQREALLGRNTFDVNPSLPARWRDVHQQCIAGGTLAGEEQLAVPMGHRRPWVRWEARPWRTETGSIGGIVIRFEDITIEKEAQLALVERERQLQFTLDASQAGTWIAYPREDRIAWDRRSRTIVGIDDDSDITIARAVSFIAPDDLDRLRSLTDRILQSDADHEWGEELRVIRPDGEIRWIHCVGRTQRDATGALSSLAGILLDVTDRKVAEEATRRGEQQVRLALEASGAFAWSWNPDEGPWVVNEHAAAQMGVPAGEPFVASEYLARVHPDDQAAVTSMMAAVQDERGPSEWDVTYRLSMPASDEVCFHSRGKVIRDAKGHVRQFFGITMDVTARRAAELELERSHAELGIHAAELERRTLQLQQLASSLMFAEQRMRERLSKLLHDHLQQLLFSALLNVGRASAEAPQMALLGQVHSQLTDAIEETRSLSVDLLPSMLRRGDLPGALTWLGEWMQEKYDLSVAVTIDPRANPALEDVRFLLFESVRELLFNVVKHSGTHHASLTLAVDERDQVSIDVTDEGVGFDPDTLTNRPTSDEGLGLFGMRERLALFGGRLRIESAPGQGARFRLTVRRDAPDTPRQTPVMPEPNSTGPGPLPGLDGPRPLRILVADDHATVREALRYMLAQYPDFLVVGEAEDGIDAVHQARLLAPDAVIMDVSMPRMNGIDAIRRIRRTLPSAHLFGLSSDQETRQPHATEEAGARGYFFKGDLTRLVEQLALLHTEVCAR